MDEFDLLGFIPNGGRVYYLDRSQPPLFIQMVSLYIEKSNDTSILPRALPLMQQEMAWWTTNRTQTVTGPSGQEHEVALYKVTNTAPRPEVKLFTCLRYLADLRAELS